jgi:hypothetical protein
MSLSNPFGARPEALEHFRDELERVGGRHIECQVVALGSVELTRFGLGSMLVELLETRLAPGSYVFCLSNEEFEYRWIVLACVPRRVDVNGRGAEAIVFDFRGRTQKIVGKGDTDFLVPLTISELAHVFPVGSPIRLGPGKRIGNFQAIATGPWLRERILQLLDDLDRIQPSKL